MDYTGFSSKLLCDDTWVIYIGNTTAYLIAGDEEGIMIDSGNYPGPLREFAESVCGKPVRKVANTHGHFDHTGGNGYFETAYMGKLAETICRVPNGNDPDEDKKFPMDYDVVIVNEGDIIDVKGRELEVFILDGHSPDSTAYLDKKMRLLFVGDNVGKAPLMYKCEDPQPSLLRYAMNLSKIMARRTEFDYVLRGHEDCLRDGDILQHTLIAALRGLDLDLDERPPRPQGGPGGRGPGGPGGPGGKGPGGPPKGKPPGSSNPEDHAFVMYKDGTVTFDKRYIKDMSVMETALGT